jgi:hypothetical protein
MAVKGHDERDGQAQAWIDPFADETEPSVRRRVMSGLRRVYERLFPCVKGQR